MSNKEVFADSKAFVDRKLYEDYSQRNDLEISEIIDMLFMIDRQKEDFAAMLARKVFIQFNGRNLKVEYADGHEIIIVCRGMKFYVYDQHSLYVDPEEYTYNDIVNMVENDKGAHITDIKEYRILSNDEAIEEIRLIYVDRAARSKRLLSEILAYKE